MNQTDSALDLIRGTFVAGMVWPYTAGSFLHCLGPFLFHAGAWVEEGGSNDGFFQLEQNDPVGEHYEPDRISKGHGWGTEYLTYSRKGKGFPMKLLYRHFRGPWSKPSPNISLWLRRCFHQHWYSVRHSRFHPAELALHICNSLTVGRLYLTSSGG